MRFYFLALGTLVYVCVGCVADGHNQFGDEGYYAPPAERLARPGPMVDGPGPAVMQSLAPAPPRSFATQTTQLRFVGPIGMQIGWQIQGGYASNQLMAPGRYNYQQGATYRLKLVSIPGREGLTLYPTLQVYPSHPITDAYLSHNSVPIEITDEDLDQVESNNFVTKVIYLPNAKFQELAIAGVETLVSTRLDPGVDPVAEADRRGAIMAVLRLGNMDLEMPNQATPPGNPNATYGMPGGVMQVAYQQPDGSAGQFVPPMPIGGAPANFPGVPAPMMVGGGGRPGMPATNPMVAGAGMQSWGMPMTSTPIGLPGPPHLPFGRPAGLQSHTIRNQTKVNIPKPVDHFLMDVSHSPGINMPAPVKHVQYSETHPTFGPGELAYPAWGRPQGGIPQR